MRDGHATLLCAGRRVAPVEIAASYRARARGLLGRAGIDGAILLTPCLGVHTMGMRFPIDVAYLTRELGVLAVVGMRPNRVGMPRLGAQHVLEAEWGALARWEVHPGVRVDLADVVEG